ncbi:hypothetical protein L202_08403 [Cryptococcus amylolentus CBS 6039]|uniref:Uncharacterized protein n=2 Tax=Cryptococcus amylolentus TaxID=104669 RepID=A0A1E3H9N2_9TREE|nr:hypothetical protein L202_08403 [Cryptococcus amylolentus CBS 6039]ODN73004.1 hypothetical protein L202_08403 [Cryptococcus amylolentus CBS 6039]ODN98161.1 hypothetical protein I350_07807 [Cryptococcus amylolentus CBS 6273]
MNRTTLSKALSRTPNLSRPSSSTSYAPPKKSTGRALSASTLRSLVSLHHSSAGFLHSPTELPVGFENAFRHTKPPAFDTYEDFRRSVHATQALHPPGGMENLVEKGTVLDSSKAGVYTGTQKAFKRLPSAQGLVSETDGVKSSDRALSERQMRVKEAIYGTWERGGSGMNRAEPALDGVLEYIEAKGKTVGEYAQEWEKRDAE